MLSQHGQHLEKGCYLPQHHVAALTERKPQGKQQLFSILTTWSPGEAPECQTAKCSEAAGEVHCHLHHSRRGARLPEESLPCFLPEKCFCECSYWLVGMKKNTLKPPESSQLWCRLCFLLMTTYLEAQPRSCGLVTAVPALHETGTFALWSSRATAWTNTCDTALERGVGVSRVSVMCFKGHGENSYLRNS